MNKEYIASFEENQNFHYCYLVREIFSNCFKVALDFLHHNMLRVYSCELSVGTSLLIFVQSLKMRLHKNWFRTVLMHIITVTRIVENWTL